MLSPDVVSSCQLLSDAYNQLLGVRKYANVCNSLFIGKPGEIDPQWLIAVRNRTGLLKDTMAEFSRDQPDITSSLLYPFINYQTLFSALADEKNSFKTAADWLPGLQSLKDAINQAITSTDSANQRFKKDYQAVSAMQPLLEASIQEGWSALADEEQQMVAIATAIGKLQQEIHDIGQDLTASDLRNGKSYVQSTVTIAYGVVMTAEMSIPFLSFAAVIFTIGSSVYDVITTSQTIQKDLDALTELQNTASAEAQAAAATKVTIQLLSTLEKSFLSIQNTLPAISQMWKAELEKINEVITALNSGSDPALYFDLQTIKIAEASWTTLFDLVQHIQAPIAVGKPVTVNIS
jgi:hypothetical protein